MEEGETGYLQYFDRENPGFSIVVDSPPREFLPLFSIFAQEDGGKPVRTIHVFVALCDNATQGIIPVNAQIGNGNDPGNNLYWGCSDGLRSYFKASSKWKLIETKLNPSKAILERLVFQHKKHAKVRLIAEAYRGSEMKLCLSDYFNAAVGKENPARLVAFIGHNGLMEHDREIVMPLREKSAPIRDVIALSCVSNSWFSGRFASAKLRAVLMTEQLMYPGAFVLHDAIEGWLLGESRTKIRERAGRAYARNQKIPVKSALGVFSTLEK